MFATASCKLKVLAETGARLTALTEHDGGVRLSQRDIRSDVWWREDFAIWETVLVISVRFVHLGGGRLRGS